MIDAEYHKLVERVSSRARTMNGTPVGAGDGDTYVPGYYTGTDRELDIALATAIEALVAERDKTHAVLSEDWDDEANSPESFTIVHLAKGLVADFRRVGRRLRKCEAALWIERKAGDQNEASTDEWRARAEAAEAKLREVEKERDGLAWNAHENRKDIEALKGGNRRAEARVWGLETLSAPCSTTTPTMQPRTA